MAGGRHEKFGKTGALKETILGAVEFFFSFSPSPFVESMGNAIAIKQGSKKEITTLFSC